MLKVWLDDCRPAPDGWHRVYTAEECIALLKRELVEEMSLDHDLGTERTGYDVLKWLEYAVAYRMVFAPPSKIHVHSMNVVGRAKMLAAIEAIQKIGGLAECTTIKTT